MPGIGKYKKKAKVKRGFKMKSPYHIDWTPIYRTLDEDGILGLA